MTASSCKRGHAVSRGSSLHPANTRMVTLFARCMPTPAASRRWFQRKLVAGVGMAPRALSSVFLRVLRGFCHGGHGDARRSLDAPQNPPSAPSDNSSCPDVWCVADTPHVTTSLQRVEILQARDVFVPDFFCVSFPPCDRLCAPAEIAQHHLRGVGWIAQFPCRTGLGQVHVFGRGFSAKHVFPPRNAPVPSP